MRVVPMMTAYPAVSAKSSTMTPKRSSLLLGYTRTRWPTAKSELFDVIQIYAAGIYEVQTPPSNCHCQVDGDFPNNVLIAIATRQHNDQPPNAVRIARNRICSVTSNA